MRHSSCFYARPCKSSQELLVHWESESSSRTGGFLLPFLPPERLRRKQSSWQTCTRRLAFSLLYCIIITILSWCNIIKKGGTRCTRGWKHKHTTKRERGTGGYSITKPSRMDSASPLISTVLPGQTDGRTQSTCSKLNSHLHVCTCFKRRLIRRAAAADRRSQFGRVYSLWNIFIVTSEASFLNWRLRSMSCLRAASLSSWRRATKAASPSSSRCKKKENCWLEIDPMSLLLHIWIW